MRLGFDVALPSAKPFKNTYDVIKQIAILTQLTDEHAWDLSRVLRNADTLELDDIGVTKLGKEFELPNVHFAEMTAELGDGHFATSKLANVHATVSAILGIDSLFEPSATYPLELLELLRFDDGIFQT